MPCRMFPSVLFLVVVALGSVLPGPVSLLTAAESGGVTKYLRFQIGDRDAYGILEGEKVRELDGDLFGAWKKTDKLHALKDVTLLIPSRRPSKVLALAGNYQDHLGDVKPPPHPEPFIKLPSYLPSHSSTSYSFQPIPLPQSHPTPIPILLPSHSS